MGQGVAPGVFFRKRDALKKYKKIFLLSTLTPVYSIANFPVSSWGAGEATRAPGIARAVAEGEAALRSPRKEATDKLEAAAPRRTLQSPKQNLRKLTLWPLVAATFFMVSGGTYGTEDIVHGAGYLSAILILLVTPILWSLPTALMLGELSSSIPAEGGYYAWVRRAMGNFWGFQEAWLSLVAS